ncbi:hypothetical protein IU443_29260 [Nocardia farcinica]|uniref:hypothetical protein n=1 Tax=Nocardia farcinica TaxID=37329 RepID=UPI00189564EC|nr:hypothetical protein [Nocardia farcinica]MBF6394023.1 hypothetical protein [Nocardia farcinica]MBF6538180.1 hypothetical protein [Nocardia farcinica]
MLEEFIVCDLDEMLRRIIDLEMAAFHPADRDVTFWISDDGFVWKDIGRITVHALTARIDVWPFGGPDLSASDLELIRARSVDAWINHPHLEHNRSGWTERWSQRVGRYWEAVIATPSGVDIATRR